MSERRAPEHMIWLLCGVGSVIALVVVAFGWWQPVQQPDQPVVAPRVAQAVDQSVALPRLPRPPLPDEGYVGGRVCATCHAEIARSYQRHPMSHSLTSIELAPVIEDYQEQNSFVAGNCTYRIERKGDQVAHHEILADASKAVIYNQAVDMHYALGSGTRGRSYLVDRDGVFYMSPIGWYTGKSWDLSPGYVPNRHQRFNRRVTDGCLQCHAGRVNANRTRRDFFPSPPFHEAAISCERCHGPGQQHVEFHNETGNRPQADPIVNPARLESVEREAVCYQCHLQATERILRYGRGPHDFRPGHKINDIWTVMLSGTGVQSSGSTDVVTQVEQIQSSKCNQASAGKFGCTSCHDPHDVPDPTSRSGFYQAKCLNCHADQGCSLPAAERDAAPALGSCVHCHMPPLQAEVVPHTTQTDHRIVRNPTAAKPSARGRSLTIFQETGFVLLDVELARARGLMLIRMAEGSANEALAAESESLLRQFLAVANDDEEVLEALGAASLILSRPQAAEEFWKTILKTTPQHERALFRLATLAHDSGRLQEARDWFAKLREVNPNLPEALARNAHVLGQLGEVDEAVSLAKRALELDPQFIPVYGWLGEAEARRGNRAESERYSQLRERLIKQLSR